MNTSVLASILLMAVGYAISILPFIPDTWVLQIKCWYLRTFKPTIPFYNNHFKLGDTIVFDNTYIYVGKNKVVKQS